MFRYLGSIYLVPRPRICVIVVRTAELLEKDFGLLGLSLGSIICCVFRLLFCISCIFFFFFSCSFSIATSESRRTRGCASTLTICA